MSVLDKLSISDIEIINNDKFLVKIQNIQNNTTQIINKVITHEQANETLTCIANTIKVNSTTQTFTFNITDSVCQIFAEEEIIIKGYIFNTSTTVTKIIYELSLIKIDDNIYFNKNSDCECECTCDNCKCENCECESLDKSTQYILHTGIDNETQTQQTQTELETIYEMYEGPEMYEGLEPEVYEPEVYEPEVYDYEAYKPEVYEYESPDLESVSDFGEFQGANFVEINLNEHNLPYSDSYSRGSCFNENNYFNFNNVIVPEYNPPPVYYQPTPHNFNSYSYNTPTQIQGSRVPCQATQMNSWSPELMNELSNRLNLPNSGLNSTHFPRL